MSYLKNPIVLIIGFSVLMMFCMPSQKDMGTLCRTWWFSLCRTDRFVTLGLTGTRCLLLHICADPEQREEMERLQAQFSQDPMEMLKGMFSGDAPAGPAVRNGGNADGPRRAARARRR